MANRIEQIIGEIEDYVAECKPQKFSSTNIVVNKDEIEELLAELKASTPDEIKRYQKIISNQEAILADAKAKAEAIIAEAKIHTDELISEHQIMQQAYAQANEVVIAATKQAQQLLDEATTDANNIRMAAMNYTDDMLANLELIIKQTMDTSKARHEALTMQMSEYYNIISSNRKELHPEEEEEAVSEMPVEKPNDDFVTEDFHVDVPLG